MICLNPSNSLLQECYTCDVVVTHFQILQSGKPVLWIYCIWNVVVYATVFILKNHTFDPLSPYFNKINLRFLQEQLNQFGAGNSMAHSTILIRMLSKSEMVRDRQVFVFHYQCYICHNNIYLTVCCTKKYLLAMLNMWHWCNSFPNIVVTQFPEMVYIYNIVLYVMLLCMSKYLY
jgi:hypothetical protein